MSKLQDLIQELCPNGVEYKGLEDIVEILDNKRMPITKSARVAVSTRIMVQMVYKIMLQIIFSMEVLS